MALGLGELYVNLGANTVGLTRAERHAQRFARATERSFRRVARAANFMGIAISGVVAVAAAKKVINMADSFNQLEIRIKTATRATNDYASVQARLLDISLKTGSEFGTNVKLFQRLARAGPEVGATNGQMVQLTETVANLGILSGASAEAMKFGLLQFSQGIAATIFRAEEMNSVMENLPELAVRIAKGMGMTVGEMRMAVIDGKLLSQEVFESLAKQSRQIAREFAELPITVDRALANFKTSMSLIINRWDELSGQSQFVADVLTNIGNWLRQDHTDGLNMVVEAFSQIGEGARNIQYLFSGNGDAGFWATWGPILKTVGQFLVDLPITLKNVWVLMEGGFAQLITIAVNTFRQIKLGFKLAGEFIGMGWDAVVYGMGNKFTEFVSGFKILWAETLQLIASGIGKIPGMGGMASDLDAYAQQIIKTANATTEASNTAYEARQAERQANIKAIQQEQWIANRTAELTIEASNRKIAATMAEGEALREKIKADRQARAEAREAAKVKKAATDVALDPFASRIRLHQEGITAQIAAKKADKAREVEQAKIDEANAKKHAKAVAAASRDLESLQGSLLTELEIENAHYAQSLLNLETAENLNVQTIISYNDLRERLAQQHADKVAKIQEDAIKKSTKAESAAAFLGLQHKRDMADEGGKQDAKIFASQIAAAAQHSKEAFELHKAMSLATAVIDGFTAVQSAYAFGSKFGGPIGGGIAAAVAAAATAVQISAIQSSRFSGGKAAGGDVSPGAMYRVNENGPEMLSSGGKDYLMMGSSGGHITPNNMMGGNAAPKIIVNVHTKEGDTASVEQKQDGSNTQIDVFVEAIENSIASGIQRGNSPVGDAIEGVYGANRANGASR